MPLGESLPNLSTGLEQLYTLYQQGYPHMLHSLGVKLANYLRLSSPETAMEIKIGSHTIGAQSPHLLYCRYRRQPRWQTWSAPNCSSAWPGKPVQMQPSSRISALPISSRIMDSPTWMDRSPTRPAGKSLSFRSTRKLLSHLSGRPFSKQTCDEVGIDFFSAPYDFEAIDMLDPYVQMYKAGSGEIDWIEALERMASKGKPFFVATGASDIGEVQRAVHAILKINPQLVLMQCNTNYTASPNNYDHLHLNVLKTYASMFPDVILGLSDHTHAVAPVLGAVTLGARVIERHFTDSNERQGPDHKFAMNPQKWADMVEETRILERSLGRADKFVAGNEIETADHPAPLLARCPRNQCR